MRENLKNLPKASKIKRKLQLSRETVAKLGKNQEPDENHPRCTLLRTGCPAHTC